GRGDARRADPRLYPGRYPGQGRPAGQHTRLPGGRRRALPATLDAHTLRWLIRGHVNYDKLGQARYQLDGKDKAGVWGCHPRNNPSFLRLELLPGELRLMG